MYAWSLGCVFFVSLSRSLNEMERGRGLAEAKCLAVAEQVEQISRPVDPFNQSIKNDDHQGSLTISKARWGPILLL